MSISFPSADFAPTLSGYTGQGAFRFWCQKVLPIVYDDSLSYYELLNKVVVYLNNVISDVSTMGDNIDEIARAFGDLQAFVNEANNSIASEINTFEDEMVTEYESFNHLVTDKIHEFQTFLNNYFDNLDVQQEINNKLDEMASDGTLDNIITPVVNAMTPLIIENWLNSHITPTTPPVDNTLSVSGAAADSKVTGDRLRASVHGKITGVLTVIDSTNGAEICNDNLDNVETNSIYGVLPYSGLTGLPDLPALTTTYGGLLVTLSKEISQNSSTKTQVFWCRDGSMHFRMYWGTGYGEWFSIPSDLVSTVKTLDSNAVVGKNLIINSDTGSSICSNDLNNVGSNTIYAVVPYSELLNIPNLPVISSTYGGLLVTLSKEKPAPNATLSQIYLCRNGDIYFRMYWNTFTSWTLIPANINQRVTSLENLSLKGANANITSSTGTEICSDDLNNVKVNTMYGIVPYSGLANLPNLGGSGTDYGGLLVTMSKEAAQNNATKTQIYIGQKGLYYRQYWGSGYRAWVEMARAGVSGQGFVPTGQNITNDTVTAICNGDANNIPNNNIYGLSVGTSNIAHMPLNPNGVKVSTYNGTLITFGKETARGYGDTQLYYGNHGSAYFRNYTGGAWNRWTELLTPRTYRILGLGDSICEGWRNNNMGFVGGLNTPYTNKGVTGATLGVKSDHAQISSQLLGTLDSNYTAIIADGGINDYYFNVPLGTPPTQPATTSAQMDLVDKTTVCGGLEYLFYLMITRLPRAHRFFLITHKTNNYPFTPNSAGYTQQQLHDAIVAVCNVYNVEVIDVYKDGIINTAFSYYKSPTPYSEDQSITSQYYTDSDGIHPLWFGYEQGYYPLVRKALLSATYDI